jgi:hypothetical protein
LSVFINADGTDGANVNYCATDYIKISDLEIKTFKVKALMANSSGGGIYFYNENMEFISGIYNVTSPSTWIRNDEYKLSLNDIPTGTCYVRVSAYKAASENEYAYVLIEYSNASLVTDIGKIHDDGKTFVNLLQDDFINSASFINANGIEVTNSSYCATDYLLVKCLYSLKCNANFSNEYGGGIAFYDIDGKFISSIYNVEAGSTSANEEYVLSLSSIPSNAFYFRICGYKSSDESNKAWANIIYLDSKVYSVSTLVSRNLNALNAKFEDNLNKINIFLTRADFVIDGEFINANGTIGYMAYFNTTDYMPIRGIVSLNVNAVMDNMYGGGIAFYDKDFNFIESIYNISGGSSAGSSFSEYEVNLSDIPGGAYFIRVQGSQNTGSEPYVNLVLTTSKVYSDIYQYEKAEDVKIIKEYLANSAASLTSLQVSDTPQTKNLYNIGVSMLVDTMGEIQITKGVTEYRCGKVSITDTNVVVYDPNAPSTILQTIPHGLTIADLLIVNINVSDTPTKTNAYTYFANLQICTNASQTFETEIAWTGCSGNAKIESLSGSYSNAKIYFGGDAFKKDVWVFGDSYTDAWCKWAIDFGAKNYMIDGKSGRGSTEAITSLQNALKLGIPKMVVWMMGMNNGDTSEAVNSTWMADFNTLLDIASEYGFKVVPCTIPNTPTVTNYYKNQVVKSSGLDYIDVADILGADEIGSSWFTGLINTDNVHPSDRGAKVIAQYLISCIPKMIK